MFDPIGTGFELYYGALVADFGFISQQEFGSERY